jgi:MFS family permease
VKRISSVAFLYFPSFFVRYGFQYLMIGLPWFLQAQGYSLDQVATFILPLFTGSMIGGLSVSLLLHKLRTLPYIVGGISISSMLISILLLSGKSWYLFAVLTILGLTIGWLRPLAKIWIVEGPGYLPHRRGITQHTSYTEIAIGIGMAVAGFLGSHLAKFSGDASWLTVWNIITAFGPILLVTGLTYPIWDKIKTGDDCHGAPGGNFPFRDLLKCFKQPNVFYPIVMYLLSILVFKLWIIAVPFELRAIFYTERDYRWLSVILSIHPLAFIFGYLILSSCGSNWISGNTALSFLVGGILAQGVLTSVSCYMSTIWSAGLLILIGGGVIAAFIFPSMMFLLEDSLNESTVVVKRGIMVLVSLATDIGQVMGSFLLTLTRTFDNYLALMILLLLILLLLTLTYRTTLRRQAREYS